MLAYLHYSYCSDWISKIDLDTTWWDPSDGPRDALDARAVSYVPDDVCVSFSSRWSTSTCGCCSLGSDPHKLDWIKGWDGSTLVVPLGPHRKKEGSPHEQRSGKIEVLDRCWGASAYSCSPSWFAYVPVATGLATGLIFPVEEDESILDLKAELASKSTRQISRKVFEGNKSNWGE